MIWYYVTSAFRGLRREPAIAILMVLTLAIGLAAGMATNALRYTLARDPIPGKSARLMTIVPASGWEPESFNYADAEGLAAVGAPYGDATVTSRGEMTVSIPGASSVAPQRVRLRYASANFFSMFNVPVMRGRVWTAAEATSATPVLVINARLASKLFGAQGAIGKHVRMGSTVYTVIGVTDTWNPKPRFYDFAEPAPGSVWGSGPDAFAPITTATYAPESASVAVAWSTSVGAANATLLSCTQCSWLTVWYLVRNATDGDHLRDVLSTQLPHVLTPRKAHELDVLDVRQIVANAGLVPSSVRMYAALGIAFLALCVINAAGMQLSRVLRGRSRIGIRRALGASRGDIVQQYLLDALLVGGLGGGVGIGFTYVALAGMRRYLHTYYAGMAQLDGTLLGILIALVFLCAVLVGVVPAWLASRADPAHAIRVAQ